MLKVLTWLWHQPNARFKYTARHVNVTLKAIRDNTNVPIQLACVTDQPEGIDSDIEIISMPDKFLDIEVASWDAALGMPQCFRRIAMFGPDAGEIFGERFLCIDLDVVVFGNLDHIVSCKDDFRILRGTNIAKRPYNGGMLIMDAGARVQVYNEFNQENAKVACQRFVGSDQAWISYCLEWGEKVFDLPKHGTAYLSSNGLIRVWEKRKKLNNLCLGFFPGAPKYFMDGTSYKPEIEATTMLNTLVGKKLWLGGKKSSRKVYLGQKKRKKLRYKTK